MTVHEKMFAMKAHGLKPWNSELFLLNANSETHKPHLLHNNRQDMGQNLKINSNSNKCFSNLVSGFTVCCVHANLYHSFHPDISFMFHQLVFEMKRGEVMLWLTAMLSYEAPAAPDYYSRVGKMRRNVMGSFPYLWVCALDPHQNLFCPPEQVMSAHTQNVSNYPNQTAIFWINLKFELVP